MKIKNLTINSGGVDEVVIDEMNEKLNVIIDILINGNTLDLLVEDEKEDEDIFAGLLCGACQTIPCSCEEKQTVKFNGVEIFNDKFENSNVSNEEVEESILGVLKYIEDSPIKLQSNFSRANDKLVAACASQGFISNVNSDGMITNAWRITFKGLKHLEQTQGE